jgi:hypothetical protein
LSSPLCIPPDLAIIPLTLCAQKGRIDPVPETDGNVAGTTTDVDAAAVGIDTENEIALGTDTGIETATATVVVTEKATDIGTETETETTTETTEEENGTMMTTTTPTNGSALTMAQVHAETVLLTKNYLLTGSPDLHQRIWMKNLSIAWKVPQ